MPYWTAARLLVHRERLALHCLKLAGFETYAPRIRERRLVRGRKAWVETPLFPCYVFVHIEMGWYDARWAPGISSLVMDGERPGRVPDAAIAELIARERGGFVTLPKPPQADPGFHSGDKNIPVPDSGSPRAKFPFKAMKVGDSFLVRGKEEAVVARHAAYKFNSYHNDGRQLVVRKVDAASVRRWRIK